MREEIRDRLRKYDAELAEFCNRWQITEPNRDGRRCGTTLAWTAILTGWLGEAVKRLEGLGIAVLAIYRSRDPENRVSLPTRPSLLRVPGHCPLLY